MKIITHSKTETLLHSLKGIFSQVRNISLPCKAIPLFSLFSVVRPTQIFAFSKKKSYAEGNDTLFQTNVTLIQNIGNFLPYSFGGSSSFFSLFSFEFNHDVDFSFLHCRHVDFITMSCCFQAPRILGCDTGPPSSRLLFQFFFCFFFLFFSDRQTQNQKTHSTINEKKRGWPKIIFKKKSFRELRR